MSPVSDVSPSPLPVEIVELKGSKVLPDNERSMQRDDQAIMIPRIVSC